MNIEINHLAFLWKGNEYYLEIENKSDGYICTLKKGKLYIIATVIKRADVNLKSKFHPNYILNFDDKNYDCIIECFPDVNNFTKIENIVKTISITMEGQKIVFIKVL